MKRDETYCLEGHTDFEPVPEEASLTNTRDMAEDIARICYENEPTWATEGSGFPDIIIRRPDHPDEQFKIEVDWEPSFTASPEIE